ncbi:DNA-processing protein DprA [Oceanospirillum sp. HFRX-1_2]
MLGPTPKELLQGWHDKTISAERILELLNRGHSLALAMEKWQRAGLWVVTRSDPEYPVRLKQKLKTSSPPVLFGCGNKALLNSGGLAVIGSRRADEADLAFTDQIGAKAASENIAIVSGGARGVDEAAMQGAIKQGGVVIGVMADSLLKAATSSKWRNGLMDGHTVLVSPFYPEAGFNAGNAMARNKYIYCLADSSLVIHSGKKGGTLNGAEENLKHSWVPLWVKPTTDKDAANADLVAKGGRWLKTDAQTISISQLINNADVISETGVNDTQADLFSAPAQPGLFSETTTTPEPESTSEPTQPALAEETPEPVRKIASNEADEVITGAEQTDLIAENTDEFAVNIEPNKTSGTAAAPVDFYGIFLSELGRLAKEPTTVDQLLESTQLHKSQLNDWLKRAEAESVIKKLTRPVRYQVINKQ